jgi:hypothetical protein
MSHPLSKCSKCDIRPQAGHFFKCKTQSKKLIDVDVCHDCFLIMKEADLITWVDTETYYAGKPGKVM